MQWPYPPSSPFRCRDQARRNNKKGCVAAGREAVETLTNATQHDSRGVTSGPRALHKTPKNARGTGRSASCKPTPSALTSSRTTPARSDKLSPRIASHRLPQSVSRDFPSCLVASDEDSGPASGLGSPLFPEYYDDNPPFSFPCRAEHSLLRHRCGDRLRWWWR